MFSSIIKILFSTGINKEFPIIQKEKKVERLLWNLDDLLFLASISK
jgi:hypothetical protein